MTKRTALVPGAIGITGRAIIEFLEKDGNWDIIGLSRRSNNFDRLLPLRITPIEPVMVPGFATIFSAPTPI